MSKQSSIEWFAMMLAEQGLLVTNDYENLVTYKEAKAMHQKEIVDAHVNGNKEYTIGGGYELIAEHYYNETFNK